MVGVDEGVVAEAEAGEGGDAGEDVGAGAGVGVGCDAADAAVGAAVGVQASREKETSLSGEEVLGGAE